MTDDTKTSEPKQPADRIFAGLVWAESGNPFFYCVIGEKRSDKSKSFDESKPVLEILGEDELRTFTELTGALEIFPLLHRCNTVYTVLEPKYLTYVRNFNTWRRDKKTKIVLKQTKSSSFEASLLQIKELIGEKRLIFPEDSIIKAQLTVFSKSNLKDAVDFYAVRALTLVIDAFQKKTVLETTEVPNLRAWY